LQLPNLNLNLGIDEPTTIESLMETNLCHSMDTLLQRVREHGIYSRVVMKSRVGRGIADLNRWGLGEHYPARNKCVVPKKHIHDCKGLEFTLFRLLEQWEPRIGSSRRGKKFSKTARRITQRNLTADEQEELGTDWDEGLGLVVRTNVEKYRTAAPEAK
jgi:hypothetical protein